MPSDRYETGWARLNELDPGQAERIVEALKWIAPDFAKFIIESAFGDVISRPGLDLKSREIATVAALTAMGTAAPQLKIHIHGALNVGCSPTEIVETIMQMAVYAGIPAALNGLFAAQDVFKDRGIEPNA